MSQTKYSMPEDLKIHCLSLVKGYARRVTVYHERREEVINGSPPPLDGMPKGSGISDPVAAKADALLRIEETFDTKAMKAVERAKLLIGLDMPEEQRRLLTELIWASCVEGRGFNYERRKGGLGMEKTGFYERRRKFLYEIAVGMDCYMG